MSLRPQPPEVRRFARGRGWLFPAALLALAPKCVLCVLAYAGLGALLGLSGPELCGGTADPVGHSAVWLSASAGAAIIGVFFSAR